MFATDTHIAQAGRVLFAAQLATVRSHQADLLRDADVVAVHETRKAIRRTFTAFKLFAPYYEPGILIPYRRGLRKVMRRLGRCRDLSVFLRKLNAYGEVHGALPDLANHWQAELAQRDEKLRRYFSKSKTARFLDAYEHFVENVGQGEHQDPAAVSPNKVKQLAPLLIYKRVAAVRAFEDHLENADIKRLHQFRIQIKELRYALHFFSPLMGPEIEPFEVALEEIQDVLGDLNDASVALHLLGRSAADEAEIIRYRQAQEQEIARLSAEFTPLWKGFNRPKWRRKLAASIAVM